MDGFIKFLEGVVSVFEFLVPVGSWILNALAAVFNFFGTAVGWIFGALETVVGWIAGLFG